MASSLAGVATQLERQLNPVNFKGVTTRVLLRTGVSLRPPKPDENHDQALVRKVVDALGDMGFQV